MLIGSLTYSFGHTFTKPSLFGEVAYRTAYIIGVSLVNVDVKNMSIKGYLTTYLDDMPTQTVRASSNLG